MGMIVLDLGVDGWNNECSFIFNVYSISIEWISS